MNKIKKVKFKKEGDEWKIIEEKEEDMEVIDVKYEVYIVEFLADKKGDIHLVKLHAILEKDLKDKILKNPFQNFKNLKNIEHILYVSIDIIPVYYTNILEIKNHGEEDIITKYGDLYEIYEDKIKQFLDKVDYNKIEFEEYYPLEYKNEE